MIEYAESIVLVLFVTLGLLILVWFRKITQFFSYLRENHPDEHSRMGEMTLFLNNTPRNNIAFLRFALGKSPESLGDAALMRHCRILRTIFYTCSAVFFLQLALLLGISSASS